MSQKRINPPPQDYLSIPEQLPKHELTTESSTITNLPHRLHLSTIDSAIAGKTIGL
jgi:hypothetical protein